MAKTRLTRKFDKCVKSVRKTVRARKGSNKESAAIAICTKTVLQRRGRTLKRYRKGHLQTQRKLRGGALFSDETKDRLRGMRDKVITTAKSIGQWAKSEPGMFWDNVIGFIRKTVNQEVGITTETGDAAIRKIRAFMTSPAYKPEKGVQHDFTKDKGFSPAGWKYTNEQLLKANANELTPDELDAVSNSLANLRESNGKVDMPLYDFILLDLVIENTWGKEVVSQIDPRATRNAYVASSFL